MRLFVSVDLPESLAAEVATVQEWFEDAGGLRFTNPEQAHVTLTFLGDTEPDRLPEIEAAIEEAVDAAGVDPFPVTVEDLGVFPSLDYISVVWLGVSEGSSELVQLHTALEAELTALGFEAESHEFTPHFTIARMDDARGKDLVQELVTGREPTVGGFEVREVRLTESTLTSEGPVYETVTSFEL